MGHSKFAYRAMQHFIVFDGRKRSPDAQSYSAEGILEVEQALRRRREARAPLPGTEPPAEPDAAAAAGGEQEEEGQTLVAATDSGATNEYFFENEEDDEEEGASRHLSLREYTSAYLARPMCKLEVRLLLERLAVLRLCESDHRVFLRIMQCAIPKGNMMLTLIIFPWHFTMF
jgi:Mg-chelatase subunit ChlI